MEDRRILTGAQLFQIHLNKREAGGDTGRSGTAIDVLFFQGWKFSNLQPKFKTPDCGLILNRVSGTVWMRFLPRLLYNGAKSVDRIRHKQATVPGKIRDQMYETEDLKNIPLEAVGFDINAESLFKLVFHGRTFVEIPAELTQRKYGESKLNYIKETRRHMLLIFRIMRWKIFGF